MRSLFSDRHMQALDGVCGVNDPADVLGEGEERDDLLLVAPPGLADRGVAIVLFFLEFLEPDLGHLRRFGAVDSLEIGRDAPSVLVGAEVE